MRERIRKKGVGAQTGMDIPEDGKKLRKRKK